MKQVNINNKKNLYITVSTIDSATVCGKYLESESTTKISTMNYRIEEEQ